MTDRHQIASQRVAICAIAKNEAPYIEEWVAFHLVQGVSRILVFDNESSDGTTELLSRLERMGSVDLIRWPGSRHDEMQRHAYLNGAQRLTGNADWVAFIDVDEFLFSSRYLPLSFEFAAFGHDVGAIAVGHQIFGSGGRTTYQADLVTTRFTKAACPDHPQSQWFKTVARPEMIDSFDSVHSIVLKAGAYQNVDHTPLRRTNLGWHPGHADRVAHGTIKLHHYMVKSREEYQWKQARFGGKGLEHRYSEDYFREHDAIGNEVVNDDLVRFSEPIRALISSWRDPT